MNARKLILAILAYALLALPLSAYAWSPEWYFSAGAINGNCTVSVIDIDPTSGKKVTTTFGYANGTVSGGASLDTLSRKMRIDQTVTFGQDSEAFVLAELLLSGKSSGTGPGLVQVSIPSLDYIRTHAGIYKQWTILGAVKAKIAVKMENGNPVSAVLKTGKVTVLLVHFNVYNSDGLGKVSSVNDGGEPFDATITVPTMNLQMGQIN